MSFTISLQFDKKAEPALWPMFSRASCQVAPLVFSYFFFLVPVARPPNEIGPMNRYDIRSLLDKQWINNWTIVSSILRCRLRSRLSHPGNAPAQAGKTEMTGIKLRLEKFYLIPLRW